MQVPERRGRGRRDHLPSFRRPHRARRFLGLHQGAQGQAGGRVSTPIGARPAGVSRQIIHPKQQLDGSVDRTPRKCHFWGGLLIVGGSCVTSPRLRLAKSRYHIRSTLLCAYHCSPCFTWSCRMYAFSFPEAIKDAFCHARMSWWPLAQNMLKEVCLRHGRQTRLEQQYS